MKKLIYVLLLMIIPTVLFGQFRGRWKSGSNAPEASHTTISVDTLQELTSSHGVVIKSDLKTLANIVFEMGASEEISLTDGTDTYYLLISSDAITFQDDAGTPNTIFTIDSTGNTRVYGKAVVEDSGRVNKTFRVIGEATFGATATPVTISTAGKITATDTIKSNTSISAVGTNTNGSLVMFTDDCRLINWDASSADISIYPRDEFRVHSYNAGAWNSVIYIDAQRRISIGTEDVVGGYLVLGDKSKTMNLVVSKENTVAGTDSSAKLLVDNGKGKLDLKAGDGDSIVVYASSSKAYIKSNNPLEVNVAGANILMARKFTVAHSDLTDDDTSEDELLFQIPAGGMVQDCYCYVTTQFTGGTVSACTIAIGDSDPDGLAEEHDCLGCGDAAWILEGQDGTDKGDYLFSTYRQNKIYTSATNINAQFVSTDGNLSALTAGSIDIYIVYLVAN